MEIKTTVLLLTIIALASLHHGNEVLGQQKKEKVLCDRIANQCRTSCQTYWDECHPQLLGSATSGLSFNKKTQQKSTVPTPIVFPIFAGSNGDIIRPVAPVECSQYRDDCHQSRPCCKGYNCRFSMDSPGVGKCY